MVTPQYGNITTAGWCWYIRYGNIITTSRISADAGIVWKKSKGIFFVLKTVQIIIDTKIVIWYNENANLTLTYRLRGDWRKL